MSQKLNTPKGTRDFSSLELKKREYLLNVLKNCFKSFNFQEIQTPSFENLTTLTGKYGDDEEEYEEGEAPKRILSLGWSTSQWIISGRTDDIASLWGWDGPWQFCSCKATILIEATKIEKDGRMNSSGKSDRSPSKLLRTR